MDYDEIATIVQALKEKEMNVRALEKEVTEFACDLIDRLRR